MSRQSKHKENKPTVAAAPVRPRDVALIAVVLTGAVLAVYGRILGFDFVVYDDAAYVTQNKWVNQGLTADGIVWAFTATYHAHWHPLTWLSHMLDVQLYGLKPWGHHLTNLLLHLFNTLLLFAALLLMTRKPWHCGMVAALFALHPLHVEPVAWVVGRKDLLSFFFGMTSLLAYLRYTAHRSWQRMLAVLVLFGLGLMCHPLLITWPLVLLALDVWPLQRIGMAASQPGVQQISWRRALLEKAALFALTLVGVAAAGFGIMVGVVAKLDRWLSTSPDLLAIAAYGYVRYLRQLLWPSGLIAIYPRQQTPAVWQLMLVALVWAWTVGIAVWQRKERPYLAVGGIWYLMALLPASGVLALGTHRWSDSYTYLSSVGILVAAVWCGAELCAPRRWMRTAATVFAVLLLCAVTALTWWQTSSWRDCPALLTRVTTIDPDNLEAHELLAAFALQRELPVEALRHLDTMWEQQGQTMSTPDLLNFCSANFRLNRFGQSADCYRQVLQREPDNAQASVFLGAALAAQGDPAGAIDTYQYALRKNPDNADVLAQLGMVLLQQGQLDRAAGYLQRALLLQPGNTVARRGLADLAARRDASAPASTSRPDGP